MSRGLIRLLDQTPEGEAKLSARGFRLLLQLKSVCYLRFQHLPFSPPLIYAAHAYNKARFCFMPVGSAEGRRPDGRKGKWDLMTITRARARDGALMRARSRTGSWRLLPNCILSQSNYASTPCAPAALSAAFTFQTPRGHSRLLTRVCAPTSTRKFSLQPTLSPTTPPIFRRTGRFGPISGSELG